ncbi:MAG: OsmC family protein [Chloroflexi bacterium]|nr:OsmC family protein [Chloroflexota bacterium]
MKATVNWKGNLAFEGAGDSGVPVKLDAESTVGGEGGGARPMELIALGLAGCTAMDVISILQKKRQNVTRFEVTVDAARAEEHPKVFTNAEITYRVTGSNIEENALLRAIELSATRYCPAQSMLGQVFPIDLRYEIYEEDANGERHLTCQGSWQEVSQA